jgi:predicted aminopeptidase
MLLQSCYVTTQGYHLLRQQLAAEPVDRYVAAGKADVAEHDLFQRVEDVRRFAREELGLKVGDAYTTYLVVERDHLVDVVSAARELSFERKEWWFPFFGRFPYKGFYRIEPARRLARRLDRNGWDVIIRPVDAFSTLGFFRDPLISFMSEYPPARLAELVIHEMAHATLWVRGEAQFNEEFASFVEREGTRSYLTQRYGSSSAQLAAWEAQIADRRRFRNDVLDLKSRLDEFYAGITEQDRRTGRDDLLERKREIISAYQSEFIDAYDSRYRSDRYRFFAETEVNNAYIDLFETYSGNIDRFFAFHERVGDGELRRSIELIAERVEEWRGLAGGRRPAIIEMLSHEPAR